MVIEDMNVDGSLEVTKFCGLLNMHASILRVNSTIGVS